MKKLLVLLMVLAMVAPVMADDTFDIAGEVRVRAWQNNNSGFSDDDFADKNYWDQRFRIQGTVSPADGVKAVFRIDLAEDTWGDSDWEGSRYGSGSELQVDRAYLDVTKGMVNIVAGQAFFSLGNGFVYANNQTGLALTLKTPVSVTLGYTKEDENGDTNDSEDGFDDVDHYFIQLGYAADAFSAKAYYAMQSDPEDENEPTVLGAMGMFNVGPAKVMAELSMFGGTDSADDDYVGTQLIVDASMKFSDMLTAGAMLVYSSGTDESDEIKIARIPGQDFGAASYVDLGPFNTDIQPLGTQGDIFDPGDTGSGSMGAGIYAYFSPIEGLTLNGQYVYLTANEDSDDSRFVAFESGYIANVGVDYTLTQNTTLALTYLLADWDATRSAVDIEGQTWLVGRIKVAF